MSASAETYGPLAARDRADFERISASAFGSSLELTSTFVKTAGEQNLRGYHRGDELVGGLVLIPMAQYWGGNSVSMGGFAGVAVASHARGGGLATRMMSAALVELRARKFALAALYPATQPLYRRVGFEQAGARFELSGEVSNLPSLPRTLPVRPFRPIDLPALQALYSGVARTRPGHLDRGDYVWTRVQRFRGIPTEGFVVEEGGVPAGYCFFHRLALPDLHHDLSIVDWCAQTPAAWQRLVMLVRDHASLARRVSWFGSDADPVLLLVEEQRFVAKVLQWWMIRLLDLEAAFAQRGYPGGLRGELHLDVSDDLFEENRGRFVLEVSGGEGRLRRGGDGALRASVGTLAALYAGHRSASWLRSIGRIESTQAATELADTLFAGYAPTMPDMF